MHQEALIVPFNDRQRKRKRKHLKWKGGCGNIGFPTDNRSDKK